jgi:dTDP-4-dehydrorhamnose reductase
MTRIVVTGASGQLGTDLGEVLAGRQLTLLAHSTLDITDISAVLEATENADVIINAAAFTAVEKAERDPERAFAVNAIGAKNIATAAKVADARLVQVSTDYVFDGKSPSPYAEGAPLSPISQYGRSKAEGERLATEENPGKTLIVRTAWLYGRVGPNFAQSILRQLNANETVRVVNDQIGQPTWSRDLARQIGTLIDSNVSSGIFHATNSGEASWYDFARAIARESGFDPDRVESKSTTVLDGNATRPIHSVLAHGGWEKIGIAPMRSWHDALRDAYSSGGLSSA